jgi:hypothetical protein
VKQKKKSENRNSVAIANQALQKKSEGIALAPPFILSSNSKSVYQREVDLSSSKIQPDLEAINRIDKATDKKRLNSVGAEYRKEKKAAANKKAGLIAQPGKAKERADRRSEAAEAEDGNDLDKIQTRERSNAITDTPEEVLKLREKAAEDGNDWDKIQTRERSNAIDGNDGNKIQTRERSNAITDTPEEVLFKKENKGLISMCNNSPKVLNNTVWNNLEKKSDIVKTGVTNAGIIGKSTSSSGEVTTKKLKAVEGDILSSIGGAISSVVNIVSVVKEIYRAHKGDESMISASVSGGTALMKALKSGSEAGMSIQNYVSGSVPPGIVSMLPGLGLAINAADLLINAYNANASEQNEKEMTTVSAEYHDRLKNVLGKSPEKINKLFQNEKRGKFGSRITYLRLLPEMMERMDFIKQIDDPQAKANNENAFKKIFEIPDTVNFNSLYLAIRFYEMGSKMQEINQKRKVAGARSILSGLIKIAGDIAGFFPGPGSVVAGSLKGVAIGIELSQSAAKFLQKQARDHAVLGGDTNRSSASKHKEYVSHAKSIYYFLDNIKKPVTLAKEPQIKKAEQLLKSTGVYLSAVYSTKYDDESEIRTQVSLIVESMKSGR